MLVVVMAIVIATIWFIVIGHVGVLRLGGCRDGWCADWVFPPSFLVLASLRFLFWFGDKVEGECYLLMLMVL